MIATWATLVCGNCTWTTPLKGKHAWALLVNHMRLVHDVELDQDSPIFLRATKVTP